MRRYSLKSLLILVGLLCCVANIATRWHLRSMAQYHELCAMDNRHSISAETAIDSLLDATSQNEQETQRPNELVFAFLEDVVIVDPTTGLLETRFLNMNEPRGGNKKWLCNLFDFRYVLSTPYVWVDRPSLVAEQQVSNLKNVE